MNENLVLNCPEVMTPEQVAELLQVSSKTVYKLLHSKELTCFTIGKYYRITKHSLLKFMQHSP